MNLADALNGLSNVKFLDGHRKVLSLLCEHYQVQHVVHVEVDELGGTQDAAADGDQLDEVLLSLTHELLEYLLQHFWQRCRKMHDLPVEFMLHNGRLFDEVPDAPQLID